VPSNAGDESVARFVNRDPRAFVFVERALGAAHIADARNLDRLDEMLRRHLVIARFARDQSSLIDDHRERGRREPRRQTRQLIEVDVIGISTSASRHRNGIFSRVFEIGQTNLHGAIETARTAQGFRRDCPDDSSPQR